MPSIKLGSSSSSSNSLDYVNQKEKLAQKNQKLNQKQQEINQKIATTKNFLLNHGVSEDIVNNIHGRAVFTDGYNCSMDNEAAKSQFKMTRNVINNRGSIQARTIIQSFSTKELDATNPQDWKKANEIGMKLAQKVAHNHQAYVATHIDNENHLVHNHIVYSPVDFVTGKKEHWTDKHQRAKFFRQSNDEVSLEYGMKPIIKQGQTEKRTLTERQLKQKQAYVWKDDLRNRIDNAVMNPETYNWHDFVDNLEKQDVKIEHNQRGYMTFAFTDKENKKRKARPNKLGTSYEKGVISNELGNREKRMESIKQNITKTEQRAFGCNRSSQSRNRKYDFKSSSNSSSFDSESTNIYNQYKLETIKNKPTTWSEYYRNIESYQTRANDSEKTKWGKWKYKNARAINEGVNKDWDSRSTTFIDFRKAHFQAERATKQFKETNISLSKNTSRLGQNIGTALSQAIMAARRASEEAEQQERAELEEQQRFEEHSHHRHGGMHL